MFLSIPIVAALPWLDTSKVKSGTYRPLFRKFYWAFVAVSIGLGYLGSQPAEGAYLWIARLLTFYYFFHFLVILPLLGRREKPDPLPKSISEATVNPGASHA